MEKNFWLGSTLLVLLLVLALGSFRLISAIHTPARQALEQASQAASQGDTDRAYALTAQARARWNRFRSLSASLTDHGPIEEADRLFAELSVYERTGQTEEFAACSARLSKAVQAIISSHRPSWWNLL